jgi:hypothetical protein
VTVTVATALPEPEIAMIPVEPFATAVTRPDEETVAMEGVVEIHVTAAPSTILPPASFTVAVIVAVSPMDENVRESGDSPTVEFTWPTVAEAFAVFEPDVAVRVAEPSAIEVTKPAEDTVATVVSDDDQLTVGFEIVLSFASLTVAVMVAVSPIELKLIVVGDRLIDATA